MAQSFDTPNYNDFLDVLNVQRREAEERVTAAVKQIGNTQAARGNYRSGATIKLVLDRVRQDFDAATTTVFRNLQKFMQRSDIDAGQLRLIAFDCLQQLLASFQVAAQPEKLKSFNPTPGVIKLVDDAMAKMDTDLQFKKRQFDIGMNEPIVQSPHTVNVVHVAANHGVVQQAGAGSHLTAQIQLDASKIAAALRALENELSAPGVSVSVRDAMAPDIATIQSQLKKGSHSSSILLETGKSLRSIVEGVAAGVLTPAAVAAAITLIATLGLG